MHPFDLAALHPDWQGWFLAGDGRLYGPAWRRGFTAGDLNAWPYTLAENRARARTEQQLRRELERLQDELNAAEKRAAFYRRQCQLEARFALMFDQREEP
jgi:hypothetical protein